MAASCFLNILNLARLAQTYLASHCTLVCMVAVVVPITGVNDQQWSNHKHLYDKWLNSSSVGPCIWFVPRAPENLLNMWHLLYIYDMFDYVIQTFLVLELIDVNRVYLSGYSAGGDGVYKLGPRMADRLAGAAMCGGHPNGASMLSLRNCFFSIQVGEHDAAYNRNGVALEYSKQLENLKYF